MSFRKDYKGVEGKTRYLTEVLEEYHSSEALKMRSARGWVRHGTSDSSSFFVVTFVALVLASFGSIMYYTVTGEPFGCVATTFSLGSLAITVAYARFLDGGPDTVLHPGWYRSYDTSLTDAVERMYRSLTKASYEVDVYRGRVENESFDARGTIYRIPRQRLTLTLMKGRRSGSRVIVLIETSRRSPSTEVKWMREVVDRVLHGEQGEPA
jgi:hypothetical protein